MKWAWFRESAPESACFPLGRWLPDNASNAQHREEHPHDGNQRQNSHVAGFADGLTKEHDTFRLCIIFRLISSIFFW